MTHALPLMLALLLAPVGAAAHPHVFIDATVEIVFDAQGRAEALRIGWTYDDLFSLSYLTEMGFDPDFDGVLSAEETVRLTGFDTRNWDADFPGDTYALVQGSPIGLSRPEAPTVRYDGGKLTSTHLRHLSTPVDLAAAELVVQVYDPSFYTSYSIDPVAVLTNGAGCTAQVFEPDRAVADARLEAALQELAGSGDAETDFPAIGSAYAEEVRVTCRP